MCFKPVLIFVLSFLFYLNVFSQNESPFFQFGLTTGLNITKLNRNEFFVKYDSIGVFKAIDIKPHKNSATPQFGVNSVFNFTKKVSLRSGVQYSYRGSNFENPIKKYRINFIDIYIMPGITILPGFKFEAGVQYSILYAQYYKIMNGSFKNGEERVKIKDYKSRPEFMVGLDMTLQKNLSIYAKYTIPTKTLDASNFQLGISLMINDNDESASSGKTAYSLEQLYANPLAYSKLVIHRSDLTELSSEIGKCLNLEEIKLNGNKLKTLPKEIGNLVNLKLLEVGFNELEYLPNEIGNLKNLEFLRINNNKLRQLPPQIGMLENLRFFTIGKNELEFLPDEIGNLSSLSELDVVSSGLMKLPETIVKLKKLEYLYISNPDIINFVPASVNLRLKVYLNGSRI